MKSEDRKANKGRGILRSLGLILGALLLAVLFFAGALLILPLAEKVDTAPVPGSADWMSRLPDDLSLAEIVLPGSHDSATQYVQLAWFSKCQSLSVYEQLEAGTRYLDIRLGDAEKDADFPRLMHGFVNCKTSALGDTLTLDTLLGECYSFLTQHPTETVLFAVKHEYGDASAAEVQKTLQGFIDVRPGCWLLTDTIPTLGEARGKLVLLRRWEDEAGLGAEAGIPILWSDQKSREDVSLSAVREEQGSLTLRVQDRFKYDAEEKWSAFISAFEKAKEGEVLLNFLSTNGSAAYGHPWKYAGTLNPRLLEMDEEILRGWIIVDFISPKLAEKIYSANFES